MPTLFRRWNVQVPGSRSLAWIAALAALLLSSAFPAQAISCLGSNLAYSETGNNSTTFSSCPFWGRCQQPIGTLLGYSFNVPGCDPHSTSCGMTASVAATFPGNHQNDPSLTGFVYSFAEVDLKTSTGSFVGACGTAGAVISQDTGTATISASVTCSSPSASHYTLTLIFCPSASPGSCTKTTSVDLDFAAAAGCNTPPPDDCNTCGGCVAHAGGGPPGCSSPVSGGGLFCGLSQSGPGAHLAYRAGGAGGLGFPDIFSYDTSGNRTSRTIEGAEGGSSFSYATTSTFNGSGRPLTVDPPGYGTTDETTYTYDSGRGDLLPLTRTAPVIGATTFGYDGFNRRTSVTDPNGGSGNVHDTVNLPSGGSVTAAAPDRSTLYGRGNTLPPAVTPQ